MSSLHSLFSSRGINPVPAVDLLPVSEYILSIVVPSCGLCFHLAPWGGFCPEPYSCSRALGRSSRRHGTCHRVIEAWCPLALGLSPAPSRTPSRYLGALYIIGGSQQVRMSGAGCKLSEGHSRQASPRSRVAWARFLARCHPCRGPRGFALASHGRFPLVIAAPWLLCRLTEKQHPQFG